MGLTTFRCWAGRSSSHFFFCFGPPDVFKNRLGTSGTKICLCIPNTLQVYSAAVQYKSDWTLLGDGRLHGIQLLSRFPSCWFFLCCWPISALRADARSGGPRTSLWP